jgi:hypothetical protein
LKSSRRARGGARVGRCECRIETTRALGLNLVDIGATIERGKFCLTSTSPLPHPYLTTHIYQILINAVATTAWPSLPLSSKPSPASTTPKNPAKPFHRLSALRARHLRPPRSRPPSHLHPLSRLPLPSTTCFCTRPRSRTLRHWPRTAQARSAQHGSTSYASYCAGGWGAGGEVRAFADYHYHRLVEGFSHDAWNADPPGRELHEPDD